MIKEFLDKASAAYYKGNPIISDEEFDILAERYAYEQLGDPEPGEVKHFYRMYSLQKIPAGQEPPKLDNPITTPKLDGAAIAITYLRGELISIVTRGNGILGQDVTDKVRHLVPEKIGPVSGIIQINAEITAPKHIPRARNYAAGALNLKDVEEVKSRDLHVFAYDVEFDPGDMEPAPHNWDSY